MVKDVYKQKMITPTDFNAMILKLREYFSKNGFIETYPQHRTSIMAACEDPRTVSSYIFDGVKYPLPQTNQMWLEYDLLHNDLDGVYCVTTSYRDEPNPIEDRHDKIFPMFEFEHKGNYSDLISTVVNMLIFLGFEDNVGFTYDELCSIYKTNTLTAEHELKMWEEYGDVVIITDFPHRTDPFWNMKMAGYKSGGEEIYNKADFIVCGMETVGSAQRSSNQAEMRENFKTISNGQYAQLLYDQFTKERVLNELEEYLSLSMFPRYGGGMGLTRLLRALKIKNLI